MSWRKLEEEAPDLAKSGKRLLQGDGTVAIGFIATCSSDKPHIAPVCPIFCNSDVYICATEKSPKTKDLRKNEKYTLHAFLGKNDEEFQMSGAAFELTDENEKAKVHNAIPFASFDKSDPIFHLKVERVLWAYWERVGQPDTQAVRKRWSE